MKEQTLGNPLIIEPKLESGKSGILLGCTCKPDFPVMPSISSLIKELPDGEEIATVVHTFGAAKER